MVQKIVVASLNPVKTEAVLMGFQRVFPDETFSITGTSITSNVPDQPVGVQQTLTGARNRALAARDAEPTADFWAGLEGGIERFEDKWMTFAWVVILSRSQEGIARTGVFTLPPGVGALLEQGMELGDADDIVFGTNNSKQENGAVGLLTGNALTRTSLYAEGVILALIPFKNTQLFSN